MHRIRDFCMDEVVYLLLEGCKFWSDWNDHQYHWRYGYCKKPDYDQAEQAADKLENWLNELSL